MSASDLESFSKRFESAMADELLFSHLAKEHLRLKLKPIDPLDNERRMRQLKPMNWLAMQLGKAFLNDDQQRQDKIFELVETLKRKRGRPKKQTPTPQAIGRPKVWRESYIKLWLLKIDEANRSNRYHKWLSANGLRKSDKSKIRYILERLFADEKNRDPQSMALRHMRTVCSRLPKTDPPEAINFTEN